MSLVETDPRWGLAPGNIFNLSSTVRGGDLYLEGGGEVVFQKPELDGGFGVAKNRQHHYSEKCSARRKNMSNSVKLITSFVND